MNPQQIEALQTIIALVGGAAGAALALAKLAKTMLDVADQLRPVSYTHLTLPTSDLV